MTREKRRLRLVQRQALLAEVSQRAAMRSLADSLAEENRSATLAQRSRELVQTYGKQSSATDGGSLAQAGRFAAALGSLAMDAEKARADASQQSAWQVEALGQAQTRARRQKERLEDAKAALLASRERRREHSPGAITPSGLARNMQSLCAGRTPSRHGPRTRKIS